MLLCARTGLIFFRNKLFALRAPSHWGKLFSMGEKETGGLCFTRIFGFMQASVFFFMWSSCQKGGLPTEDRCGGFTPHTKIRIIQALNTSWYIKCSSNVHTRCMLSPFLASP